MVREEIDKDPRNVQARVHLARSSVEYVNETYAKDKQHCAKERPKPDKGMKAERNV